MGIYEHFGVTPVINAAGKLTALGGTAPKRVMCMTCDSEHNYRSPKSEDVKKAPRKKAATTKTARKTAATLAREEWETRVPSGGSFKRYNIHETFVADELVTHKKFGDGYVIVSHESTGKVNVAFADGERTLVQGVPE